MNVLDIFANAVELETAEAREQYLDQICGDNAALRDRIEALLRSSGKAASFMETPPSGADLTPTREADIIEQPGMQVGPYKLLQEIGHGGMGVVYMAEQTKPVERRAALKIIKPGMDTRQVIARFEAERQALALMDHPNIAKVLDAGATDSGRPYFVMELVKGVPITKYCDEQHLTPRERLELFIPICQAVQHAHQKGIIHRDLKPSNVLVALYDGQPVPKIIDFGVAKATHQKLTEKTMFTQYGQIVGTLEYMSPEQAELNQLDVDTRSDIYSLGVLLYELLTGVTPFERRRLASAALDEMLRVIREVEPPRPSMRVSTIDTLPSVAANRRTDPHKLKTLFRGELDWIVMKALEKDRARRYETANGFAEDVKRYLDDEPVAACPPSTGYKLRKFVRRNKGPVAAALAITVTLVAGVVGTSVGYVRSEAARRELSRTNAELQERNAHISQMQFHQGLAAAMSGNEQSTIRFVESMRRVDAPEAQCEMLLGVMHWAHGAGLDAAKHFQRAIELDPESFGSRAMIGSSYLEMGDNRFFGVGADLASLEPRTAEDYMFHALTVLAFQPDLAVQQAERSLAIYESPITNVVYSLALQEKALKDGDPRRARESLQRLQQAEIVLGSDHRGVVSSRLFALNAAILLAPSSGEDTDVMRAHADRCASQLMALSDIRPVNLWGAAMYYDYIKRDVPAARAAWQRIVQGEQGGDIWTTSYAAFLLRNDGVNVAVNAWANNKHRSSWGKGMELQLLTLDAEGRNQAKQLWKQYGNEGAFDWAILVGHLLHDHEGVKTLGEKWSNLSRREIERSTIDYMRGEVPEAEFIRRAGSTLTAHYWIAMKAYGDEDFAKAEQHFQAIVDTRYYKHWIYGWAEGMLAHMERESNPVE